MLKAVIKRRAFQDIVEQISSLIQSGKLKRGDQLPPERELSETFGVSRATVREAFMSLVTMGLVNRRQGNGTYVIHSAEDNLVQPLASALYSEKDTLIDIFELRFMLEPELALLAAENATDEQIAELERVVNRSLEHGLGVQEDREFHQLLCRMSRNRVFERLLLAIDDLVAETRDEHLQSEERKKRSLEGHRHILSAIQSRNGRAARLAMRTHLDNVERIVFTRKPGRSA